MATDTAGAKFLRIDAVASEKGSVARVVETLFMPLASLRLTVALFAMAIFIVFVGTLAQVDKNMWEVMEGYFRAWLTWIDLAILFPRTWFPSWQSIPGGFYFPGGKAIGLAMFVNLLAAHTLRFSLQARGKRLAGGLALAAVGALLTWLVIAKGHNEAGLQGLPLVSWSTLWLAIEIGLGLIWMVLVGALVMLKEKRTIPWRISAVTAVGLGGLVTWLLWQGEAAALGDSAMRILWQLVQGGLAALVLLGGCVLLFKKRAGIVLLHGGIGLIMFGELLVELSAVEERITMAEGQTINFASDIRTVELAVVDRSNPEYDQVTAIPRSWLECEGLIRDESLPLDIQVVRYLKNSQVRRATPGESTLATAGKGLQFVADELRPGSGTDASGKVDEASLYARFLRKNSSQELGTYLLSQCLFDPTGHSTAFDEKVTVDEKTYDVSLRFKRNYKPYSLQLIDVRKDDYLGTDTPMNYSSDVRLVSPDLNVDRKIHIWMNNPLRFAGETFYQSGYQVALDGTEVTDLQVVTNTGWMIPYVGCMIVATGMLFHFSVTLLRFLRRRRAAELAVAEAPPVAPLADRGKRRKAKSATGHVAPPARSPMRIAPWVWPPALAVALLGAAWLVSQALVATVPSGQLDLEAFGRLPVVYEGRVKPLDTLARNSLRIVSERETFKEDHSGARRPAIAWLLDVIGNPGAAGQHKVFKIPNLEVLETLGLTRRKGFRYALDEFIDRIDQLEKEVEKARETAPERLSVYQRKMLELDRRIRAYMMLSYAFRPIPIPPLPSEEQFAKDKDGITEQFRAIKEQLQKASEYEQFINRMKPPLAVPTESAEQAWLPYATAWHRAYLAIVQGQKVNPATLSWQNMLDAYAKHDVGRFNAEVLSYQAALNQSQDQSQSHSHSDNSPRGLDPAKTRFEVFFNETSPFYHCAAWYLVAFFLAAAAWLGWSRFLNRTAFALIALTFAVHTLALIARIYISGRPPITNLYSTAIFIGWGCVILGMILESVYRLGTGNALAAVAGFSTLLIAHFLAGDGDTFTVLQAVLDTQFWLATHVVTINMGYATTFMAGLLGALYILRGLLTPSLSPAVGKELARMVYGALCFAIFFSFVGTVLGGLWADDSWGRFWGWDPKENGALIIVLWNALALHARWGGMVKERGLAVLAVGGNIVTSWSWFGVNELGVGLHSYGFTEGVLRTLALFVLSQMAIILAGMLPLRLWWSYRRNQAILGETT